MILDRKRRSSGTGGAAVRKWLTMRRGRGGKGGREENWEEWKYEKRKLTEPEGHEAPHLLLHWPDWRETIRPGCNRSAAGPGGDERRQVTPPRTRPEQAPGSAGPDSDSWCLCSQAMFPQRRVDGFTSSLGPADWFGFFGVWWRQMMLPLAVPWWQGGRVSPPSAAVSCFCSAPAWNAPPDSRRPPFQSATSSRRSKPSSLSSTNR